MTGVYVVRTVVMEAGGTSQTTGDGAVERAVRHCRPVHYGQLDTTRTRHAKKGIPGLNTYDITEMLSIISQPQKQNPHLTIMVLVLWV